MTTVTTISNKLKIERLKVKGFLILFFLSLFTFHLSPLHAQISMPELSDSLFAYTGFSRVWSAPVRVKNMRVSGNKVVLYTNGTLRDYRWTPDNIVDINGDKWIISKRHKTNIPFQVKLMDVPLKIIDRYKHLQQNKLVFGKMNYWSMCKKLKTVMTACGIEKAISYHCGRHSFATLALSKGMPIESVSRVLGHTNIVTTQIYAKTTSQKLDNDLTMLGNKLNASFKNL